MRKISLYLVEKNSNLNMKEISIMLVSFLHYAQLKKSNDWLFNCENENDISN